MKPIRIVLADDHELTRQGTRHILEQYPDTLVVGEAEDGEEAVEQVQKLKPDVAIVDIRMPKFNGMEVVRQMKEVSPNTEALILTAFDDDEYVLAVMEAGALGYLLKTARTNTLVDAVRRVSQGESVLDPTVAAKVWRLWSRERSGIRAHEVEHLSPREVDVLVLAAKGLRNKAIADELAISTRTVDGHFHSILAKLGYSSRVEAVLFAVSHNLVALPSDGKSPAAT
jgi:DNA-binding NarL/FixJ family response regulator